MSVICSVVTSVTIVESRNYVDVTEGAKKKKTPVVTTTNVEIDLIET